MFFGRIQRGRVVLRDSDAIGGGLFIGPKALLECGRSMTVGTDGLVNVVWKSNNAQTADTVLLTYADEESAKRAVGCFAEWLAENARKVKGRRIRWPVIATCGVVIAFVGGLLLGTAKVGDRRSVALPAETVAASVPGLPPGLKTAMTPAEAQALLQQVLAQQQGGGAVPAANVQPQGQFVELKE